MITINKLIDNGLLACDMDHDITTLAEWEIAIDHGALFLCDECMGELKLAVNKPENSDG